MRKIFQYIRRRPKHVRDNYAFGLASTFTFTILMFWVMSFSGGETQVPDGVVAQEKNIPFATLIKQSKEQFALLREAVSGTTTNTTESESETAVDMITVATSTSQLILSPEDIAKAQADLQKGTTTDNFVSEKVYQEVIIATTSASRFNEASSSSDTASTSAQ